MRETTMTTTVKCDRIGCNSGTSAYGPDGDFVPSGWARLWLNVPGKNLIQRYDFCTVSCLEQWVQAGR